MQEVASGDQQPVEDELRRCIFGIDLGLNVQIFLFALQADSDVLLVEAVVLEEGASVEELAHVLDAVGVDDVVKLVAFKRLKFHVHVAEFANRLDHFPFDTVYNFLEVQVLFGEVVPVENGGFGSAEDVLILEYFEGLSKKFLIGFHFVRLQFLLLEFLFLLNLLAFKVALVGFVLVDELSVFLS